MGSDSIAIEEKCPLILYIPNVFSPNGDNINDFFKVSVEQVRRFRMEIFSRWGERMYYTEDSQEGWNGNTASGQSALPGVYVYHIFAEGYNGKGELVSEQLSGDLTLLR